MASTTKFSVLARSFSTSSLNQQLVKAPIALFGVNGRYATALYSAATKQKTLDAVEKDLVSLHSTMKKDARFREFIVNPTIKRTLKSQALKAVADKASLNVQTSNFLQCLAENGRLKNLESIIDNFKLLMSAHRGEVICEVTTARELDGGQRQELEKVLKSFLKGKETLHLSIKVDPSIVGGMVVGIGDRFVDMSVASKIKKYTDLITASV